MKTAIILPGMPSKEEYYDPTSVAQSNKHWIPWVQRQLIIKDILAQTPEWPKPYEPEYEAWFELFNQFTVDENTVLIGHSAGAGFLVRWLSENKVKVGKVILVAPWIDPDKVLSNGMFEFEIDPELAVRTKGVIIFLDRADDNSMVESADTLRETIKSSQLIELPNHGHFTQNGMGTDKFPELVEAVFE